MLRYVALIWNPHDPEAAADAMQLTRRIRSGLNPWQETFTGEGLSVFHTGASLRANRPYRLHDDNGVVLGTLFDDSRPNEPTLGETATTQILGSGGRWLTKYRWGRYVAFIAARGTGKKWVLRDPMGGLPCFYTEHRQVVVFFSLLQDGLRLGLRDFSVNWRYMTHRVRVGPFHSGDTALKGIHELQRGYCLEFEGQQRTGHQYWDPHEIARTDPLQDPELAASHLRTATKTSVHAWAACHQSLLHRLSGGLDSSIVMGCLQDAPTAPRITSVVHVNSKLSRLDTPKYAALSAARAGCELLRRDRSEAALRFEELVKLAPDAKPLPHLAHLEYSAWESSLAKDKRATAVFTGDGGDPLFCSYGKHLVVADYLLEQGIRARAFSLASLMAPLVQWSVWKLLATSARHAYFRQQLDAGTGIVSPRSLISDTTLAAVEQARDFLHPWFRPRQETPPGKLLHIRLTLYTGFPHYMPGAESGDFEEIHPLLSQPVVETSLRIPTYVHLGNGQERGLARRAFTPDVPQEILNRFWKGRPGDFLKEQLMRRIGYVRELLLDGMLVSEGLLDRPKLETALSGRPSTDNGSVMEIFDHIVTESWLRGWTDAARQAA